MIAQPLTFEADPEARAAQRIAMAHRLAEMAMVLAEAAQRRALALMEREIAAAEAGEAAPDAAAPAAKGRRDDPIATAERMARMARLGLALAARLDSDEPVRRSRARVEAKAEREAEEAARVKAMFDEHHAERMAVAEREETIADAATEALMRSGVDKDEVLERVEEIWERFGEGEWEFDVTERPIGAVLAQLLDAMQVTPDWSVWAAEDWAVEEAATNAEGSPYAAGGAAWVRVGTDSETDPPAEDRVCEPVAADGSSP